MSKKAFLMDHQFGNTIVTCQASFSPLSTTISSFTGATQGTYAHLFVAEFPRELILRLFRVLCNLNQMFKFCVSIFSSSEVYTRIQNFDF